MDKDMTRGAYISGWGVCLPNAPIENHQIEDVLGHMKSQSAAVKRRVLINNGITRRYYAIDPATGAATHTNARLTAEAITNLCQSSGFSAANIQCLSCGTSSADQIIPNHASMVHAEIGFPPCEIAYLSGVCCSGVSALKYGYLNILAGACDNAVVTGSELASPSLRSSHFEPQIRLNTKDLADQPRLPFGNEFLRWMLSDGAGALLIIPTPRPDGPSLRIDWVDIASYASESDVCMYFGLQKHADGRTSSYRTVDNEDELFRGGYLSLSQDIRILKERLPQLMRAAFGRLIKRHNLIAADLDWVLPHYSSQWFRQPLHDGLAELGFVVPFEKWFTNLSSKGNTGSAAMYIMIDELMSTGKAHRGQRILCIVPESARMMFGFVHLTVV
jgi:3-oxoacyl-[acyl-carrier-protein] synthase-3